MGQWMRLIFYGSLFKVREKRESIYYMVRSLANGMVYGIFAGEIVFLTAEKRRNRGYAEE